jgi:hypothetical protein
MTRQGGILGPHPGQRTALFGRPGMPQDPRFYGPMRDPRGFPMGIGPMPHYAFAPPMRAPYDPYGYMGPRSHMHSGIPDAPPPGIT